MYIKVQYGHSLKPTQIDMREALDYEYELSSSVGYRNPLQRYKQDID